MNETVPLLSICIPTFNRAKMLDSALRSLICQINLCAGSVELIVSDNCSHDETQDIVLNAPPCKWARYFRQNENLGFLLNIMFCVEQAQGQFAWILGDDDLVRDKGVETIVDRIRNNPSIDFIYVNISTIPKGERDHFNRPISGRDFQNLKPLMCNDITERALEKWDELIDPRISRVYMGAITTSVFRRSLWLDAARKMDFTQEYAHSLESVFPHALIFAKTMVGRRAYYLGYPYAIGFHGKEDWSDYIPIIYSVWLHRLLDSYQKAGVSPYRIKQCRRRLLLDGGAAVLHLIRNKRTKCRNLFSFSNYIKTYWPFKEFWLGIFIIPLWAKAKTIINKRLHLQGKRADIRQINN